MENKKGRPTKYKPKYCKAIINFFSEDPYKETEIAHKNKKGDEWTTHENVPNDMPFFSDFAYKIGVDDDTLANWCEKFPDFFGAYKRAKQLQKQFLITNGLLGLYPTGSYCFTAKNITDMRDEQKVEHSGTIDIGLAGKMQKARNRAKKCCKQKKEV